MIYSKFSIKTYSELIIHRLRSTATGNTCEKVSLRSSDDGKLLHFPQRWNFTHVYCTRERVILINYVDWSAVFTAGILRPALNCVQVLFLHGGYGASTVQSDTLFLSVSADGSMRIRSLCGPSALGPSPRGCHTSVYVSGSGKTGAAGSSQIYTFGGLTFAKDGGAAFLADVHALHLGDMEWREVACTGSPPSPRAHCLGFRHGRWMYVYGGCDSAGNLLNDLHRLDLGTAAWEGVETSGEKPLALSGMRPGTYPTCTPAGGLVLGNKAVVLCEDLEKSTAVLFVLHLGEMRWQRWWTERIPL